MRCAVCSAITLVATIMASATTAQPAWEMALVDFAKVCVASLLAPDELPAVLKERDMSEFHLPLVLQDFEGIRYSTRDGVRGVTVSRYHYSDLQVAECTTIAAKSPSRDEFDDLRAQLQLNPKIGKLEGQILPAGPAPRVVFFKREGLSPIITFLFTTLSTATSATTTLRITRYDLQPRN